MMKNMWLIAGIGLGGALLIRKRYKIINMFLTVSIIRKIIVSISMRIPLVKNQMLADIMQPTK